MLLGLLIFFIVISQLKILSNKQKTMIIFFSLIILILFSFALGTDYLSYEFLYNNFSFGPSTETENIDLAYTLMTYLGRTLKMDYHTFSIVFKVTILLVTTKWIYDSSEDPSVSLILYFSMFFLVWTMSALRQGVVLAFGLYLFFNKKQDLSLPKKIFFVLLLATMHKSALYFLVLFLLQEIKWTQKKHFIIFIASLVSTFLPLQNILYNFKFIPIVDRVLLYFSDGVGFFDLSSLMRIFFFLIVFVFYKNITDSKYNKRVTDSFLVGTSLYFFMKFSELTASRITIYTFVLFVILLPLVLEQLSTVISFSKIKISIVFITLFSIFFFTKEITSYRYQTGYTGPMNRFSFMTIFNRDYTSFDNMYAYIVTQRDRLSEFKEEFNETIENIKIQPYSDKFAYFPVLDPEEQEYGVLASNGSWLSKAYYSEEPKIIGSVLIEEREKNMILTDYYRDLSHTTRNQQVLRERLAAHASDNILNSIETEELIDKDFFDIVKEPTDFFQYPNNIYETKTVKVTSNKLVYHILYVEYYDYDLYIYLDENLVPFSNFVHTELEKFTPEGLLQARTHNGVITYNDQGKIIWVD